MPSKSGKKTKKKAGGASASKSKKSPSKKKRAAAAPANRKKSAAPNKKASSSRQKAAGKKSAKKATGKKVTRKKTAASSRGRSTKKAGASSAKKTSKSSTTKKSKAAGTKKKTSKATAGGKAKTSGKKKRSVAESAAANESSKSSTRTVASVASHTKADADGYVVINGRKVRMISTKGLAKVKKLRTAAPDSREADEAARREKVRTTKTKLTAKELRHFRNLLLIKRAEIIGDLDAMEAEALRSGSGEITHMPIHMADIGTDTYDQDFMLNLAENERRRIREIDDAVGRIDEKTYGVCQMTGKPIPKSRLNAKPWAKYTIEAARMIEQGYGG